MGVTSLQKAIERTIEHVEERASKGGVEYVGIPTGFPKLDYATGGLRPKGLYYIAARTGLGKTALAMSMAKNISSLKKKVLFISLEMSAELLATRYLSSFTGIPAMNIERGKLDGMQLAQVRSVLEEIKDLTFGVADNSVNTDQLTKLATDTKEQFGLDLLIVDYITLIADPNKMGQTDRVTELSRGLQRLANELDIPVLALSQLNREVEKREGNIPTLSDLRDSGAIEQDADAVIFCYRPHYYAMMNEGEPAQKYEDDAKILLAKNRHGPVGQFSVTFVPDRMLWLPSGERIADPPPTNMGSLVAKVKQGR
jgi:replicative DNA helicase